MAAKKFKFRLEPLLKIREYREKQKQKVHAEALQRVYSQRGKLDDIDRTRLATYEYQRHNAIGPLSMTRALASSRYLMKLKRERIGSVEFLRALEKDAEEKRRLLVKAARERKIFDRLKEKQSLRHREESELAERKELDEIAVTGYNRAHIPK